MLSTTVPGLKVRWVVVARRSSMSRPCAGGSGALIAHFGDDQHIDPIRPAYPVGVAPVPIRWLRHRRLRQRRGCTGWHRGVGHLATGAGTGAERRCRSTRTDRRSRGRSRTRSHMRRRHRRRGAGEARAVPPGSVSQPRAVSKHGGAVTVKPLHIPGCR